MFLVRFWFPHPSLALAPSWSPSLPLLNLLLLLNDDEDYNDNDDDDDDDEDDNLHLLFTLLGRADRDG